MFRLLTGILRSSILNPCSYLVDPYQRYAASFGLVVVQFEVFGMYPAEDPSHQLEDIKIRELSSRTLRNAQDKLRERSVDK
jgi:hypothetical protein